MFYKKDGLLLSFFGAIIQGAHNRKVAVFIIMKEKYAGYLLLSLNGGSKVHPLDHCSSKVQGVCMLADQFGADWPICEVAKSLWKS
jgi:hypothetical protein